MTYTETNDCLKYRLLGSADLFTSWGHEYVRYGCNLNTRLSSILILDQSVSIDELFSVMTTDLS